MTPWEQLDHAVGITTVHAGATGCTVIRGNDGPFVCSAALRGRASGTRELTTCDADHLTDCNDAILLTGGLTYRIARRLVWCAGSTALIFVLAPPGRFDAPPAWRTMPASGQWPPRLRNAVLVPVGPAAVVKGGVYIGVAESGGVLAAVAIVPIMPVRRGATVGFVAMSTPLTNARLLDLARASTTAMHYSITPCGTPYDGGYSLPPRPCVQSCVSPSSKMLCTLASKRLLAPRWSARSSAV